MEKAELWESKKIVVQVEKSKEIATQTKKSSKWKGLKTIFNPFTSNLILDLVEEEIKVTVVQTMVEETN
jgi:predicted transcriptional regulator